MTDYAALGVFGQPFEALEKRLDGLHKELRGGVLPEKRKEYIWIAC